MLKPEITVISSVKEGIFSGIANSPNFGFTQAEKDAALKNELNVFIDTMRIADLRKHFNVRLIRALDGIPQDLNSDAYIMGGSPNMANENLQWINELKGFIHKEVNKGKPVLGICFGHQVLASSFGGTVDFMKQRKLGIDTVELSTAGNKDKLFGNVDSVFQSIFSHKQHVTKLGEAERLGSSEYSDNQIIKVGDNAWGVQFHPEFTPEFCAFLTKLMKGDIQKEGLDPQKILKELEEMKGGNKSSELINLFISQFWNK